MSFAVPHKKDGSNELPNSQIHAFGIADVRQLVQMFYISISRPVVDQCQPHIWVNVRQPRIPSFLYSSFHVSHAICL